MPRRIQIVRMTDKTADELSVLPGNGIVLITVTADKTKEDYTDAITVWSSMQTVTEQRTS